jgi:hypothetical protein
MSQSVVASMMAMGAMSGVGAAVAGVWAVAMMEATGLMEGHARRRVLIRGSGRRRKGEAGSAAPSPTRHMHGKRTIRERCHTARTATPITD